MRTKTKLFYIIFIILFVYTLFGLIFPNHIDAKYNGSYSFYSKVVDQALGSSGKSSLGMTVASWLGKEYFQELEYYTVTFSSDGMMNLQDNLQENYYIVKYRISPLGVVYRKGFIPYGIIVDEKLYTFYCSSIVYLDKMESLTE